MLSYLRRFLDLTGLNAHQTCDDQAIHNIIVHRGLVENIILHPNVDGPVFTMCNVSPERIKTDERGFVLDGNGNPYPVLHHYDRFPAILAAAKLRLAARPADGSCPAPTIN